MKCVICRAGDVRPGTTQAEIKVGPDRVLVSVEADVCPDCGEAYYSAEVLRRLERIREDFSHKLITPTSIGKVYQVS